MKNGRIILTAALENLRPIGIGSGRGDRSDRDVVTTEYRFDNHGEILPPERFHEGNMDNTRQLPFIPATSFLGKIFRQFDVKKFPAIEKYWGKFEGNASYIDCSDILLTKLPQASVNVIEVRDGTRIDSTKGTVAPGAKFDYELLAPGAKFSLMMIFRVEENTIADYNLALNIAYNIATVLNKGIDLGSKSTVGYGQVKGDAGLYELDFENNDHFEHWINNRLTEIKVAIPVVESLLLPQNQSFVIKADFSIRNSLIIRSYSTDPTAPDATHLKSGGKNILSGTSIKGALRSRAERILNTIQNDTDTTTTILAGLFGDIEKEEDKVTVKKGGYTVPSRVFVDEIFVEEVVEKIQTRIQIDRFTGGTVDGALFEEVPLFPEKEKTHIKSFTIKVVNPNPLDKGLMLLLLKDLWTADLPIGGEKSVGRGVLEGVSAIVYDGIDEYKLLDDLRDSQKTEVMQSYVDALHNDNNYHVYSERVKYYKSK
ncbi:MAG: hypothetical protein BGP01_00370 [Paludibacter sp. 47-17]|nr:MAG: hypothetical protein BGP01_00370 [Paludibacter sp. 47-17]